MKEIGQYFSVSGHTVKKWLLREGIYQRERIVFGRKESTFKKELVKFLKEDKSIPEIASHYKVSSTAIHNWINKLEIKGRRQNLRNKEFLYSQYWGLQKSASEIAKELGVTPTAVSWYIEKFNIKKRPIAEIRQIAIKRYKSDCPKYFRKEDNTPKGNLRLRSYHIIYKDYYCMSAAELTMCFILEAQGKTFTTQPFTFENRVPDILVHEDNRVLEIKAGNLDAVRRKEYIKFGEKIQKCLHYKYEIIDLKYTFKKEYKKVRAMLRDLNVKIGEKTEIPNNANCLL